MESFIGLPDPLHGSSFSVRIPCTDNVLPQGGMEKEFSLMVATAEVYPEPAGVKHTLPVIIPLILSINPTKTSELDLRILSQVTTRVI